MEVSGIEFKVDWKFDCQDKQDFDFSVLQVLTRYYGRDNTAIPTIYLGEVELVRYEGYIEGKDEEETKLLTEEWIKKELLILIKKLSSNE